MFLEKTGADPRAFPSLVFFEHDLHTRDKVFHCITKSNSEPFIQAMSNQLISNQPNSQQSEDEISSVESEVYFRIPESCDLNIEFKQQDPSTLDYLSYCVARNPGDLISHMRRILLYEKIGEREHLFAALIDLFIALGAKGRSLRGRLLEKYRPLLSPARYAALLKTLERGLTPARCPQSQASILSKGITGTCMLLKPVAKKSPETTSDPIKEARDYLEYSQIDAARQVLEAAVLKHPHDIEIQKELLELYRAGRDVENFGKVRKQLNRLGIPLSAEWSRVSEFLTEHA